MTIDPALDLVLRLGLATLLAWAASHKARDLRAFAATIRSYEVVPAVASRPVASVLAGAELAIATGLMLPETRVGASLAAAALLLVYTGAIGVNLARGRKELDCGCFGPAHRQPLHAWLLVRNVIVVVAAFVASLPLGSRTLTALDLLSIVAGWASVCLLWTAAGQLATQNEAVMSLRRAS